MLDKKTVFSKSVSFHDVKQLANLATSTRLQTTLVMASDYNKNVIKLFGSPGAVYSSTFVALNAMRQLCLFIKLTHCVKCTNVEQYTAPGVLYLNFRIWNNIWLA